MQTIHLEVSDKNVPELLHTKQGDVGRKFLAVFRDGAGDYEIPADAVLTVWYSGTSGEGNYSAIDGHSAFTVSGSTVEVEIITQMLGCRGGGTLCLVMNRANGEQLGYWNIPYMTEGIPGMESAAATEYYTALSETARQVARYAAEAREIVECLIVDDTLTQAGAAADAAAVAAALEQRAPAGYGLGGVIRDDTSFVADLNDVSLKTGFYYCTVNAENAPDDGFGGGPLFVVNWANGSLTRQFLMSNDLSVVYTRRYKDGTWDPWEFAYRDTGWIALTLNSSFSLYNGQIYNQPRYRVCGNTVTIRGAVSPKTAFTSGSGEVTIATGIPAKYRPSVSEYFVCNGSVMNKWCCAVKSGSGEITISKYGTSEYAEVPAGAWLPFCISYQLGG